MSGRLEWLGGVQADVLITGARVVDPRASLDEVLDVRVAG